MTTLRETPAPHVRPNPASRPRRPWRPLELFADHAMAARLWCIVALIAVTLCAVQPFLVIRAYREQVLEHVSAKGCMVDVRSPQEFSGELTHMPDYPQEGTLRGGHIPGAKSVPWKRAANDDGTFKGLADLRAIYEGEKGLAAGDDVIAYCRIGERSSHTWFVLTYLLGFKNVRNYDGSWSEWGNAVRLPIAVGAE